MSQILLSANYSANNEQLSVVPGMVAYEEVGVRNKLLRLDQHCYVVQNEKAVGVCLAEDLKNSTAGTSMFL